MQEAVRGLEPLLLWRHFSDLSDIPRRSGEEAGVRDHVARLASRLGLGFRTDRVGNMLVSAPGRGRHAGAAPVALQGHVDMVCQANEGTAHDFSRDPIRLRRDGDWIRATGTTLGADNGIGVSAALALLEAPGLDLPPLEVLLTVDEETGLTGANGLDLPLTARVLLNLDSEDDGEIFVGCSGGVDTEGLLPLARVPVAAGSEWVRVKVSGLRGGHSGADIHLGRANALRLLARVLDLLVAEVPGLELASFDGGNAGNAIPREAAALVGLPIGSVATVPAAMEGRIAPALRREFEAHDPGLRLDLEPAAAPQGRFTSEGRDRALRLLRAIPHGVEAMSSRMPGLVETSTNLGIVATTPEGLRIETSQRSSLESAQQAIAGRVQACMLLAGASVSVGCAYPGWDPDLSSRALAVVREVMREVLGIEPAVKAVHAGLECGLIGRRYPGIDMVSFGPTVRDAHSPSEALRIDAVPRFWKVLVATLDRLAST